MGKTQQPKPNKNGSRPWSEKKKNLVTAGVLFAFIALIAGICILAVRCSGSETNGTETEPVTLEPVTCGYARSEEKTDYVCLTVQYVNSKGQRATGDIVVHLRADVAPITVANFQDLVADGFYDDLTFHRVLSGFMIQGGDPKGDGTGGAANTIKGEFSTNGVDNSLSHKRGVISMARSNDPDSASSQFFIMHNDASYLDGNYAAFGEVIFGMETVDGIAGTAVTYNSGGEKAAPITAPTILKAYFVNLPSEG